MNVKIRKLTECSMMIALSFVLSIIKLAELPYGGSVTMAAMLPMVIVAYRHGLKWGIATAIPNAAIQLLLGLKYFSYFSTWQSLLALAFFDYIIAYAVFGLSGVFRKRVKRQNLALLLGILLSCVLRYFCHVISGATIWAGLSIPTNAALLYSFGYNATYMIPDTLVLCVVGVYLGSVMDFRRDIPVRMSAVPLAVGEMLCYVGAGLVAVIGTVVDTVLVFPALQDPETGEFIIKGLASVNYLAVGIVTAVTVLLAVALVIVARRIKLSRDTAK